MFSLFLFLAVSISAESVDHLLSPKKLFKDPKAFASVFSRADRDTLTNLIEMVDKLLTDGQNDLAAAQLEANNAQSASDTAASELTLAEQEKTDAETDLVIKQGETARLVKVAEGTAATSAAALTKHNTASDEADNAATFRAKTVQRTTDEKDSLNQILAFLGDYLDASTAIEEKVSRQLLETAEFYMVEEDQIQELYEMIEALIATANSEEEAANDALTNANDALTDAQAELEAADTAHSEAESELHAAELAQTQATNHLDSKTSALTSATKKAEDASNALHDATQWLTDETARVSEETSTLNDVRALLEGLLETASN